jgi:hypothetical protein
MCSFCRLIRGSGHLICDTGISRQTEAYSFGDHLISLSVTVTPSSVIEASTVLFSVSMSAEHPSESTLLIKSN